MRDKVRAYELVDILKQKGVRVELGKSGRYVILRYEGKEVYLPSWRDAVLLLEICLETSKGGEQI